MLTALLIGFPFGFFGSMPVAGPIAVLVFSRAIDNRFKSGLMIAAGAAIAESIYAFLAYWGFSSFLIQYPWIDPVSRALAAVILIGLGVAFALKKDSDEAPPPVEREGLFGAFMLGFSITALNPTFIATWTAAATMLYSTGILEFTPANAMPFSLSVCAGIVAWFALLIWLIRRFKSRFRRRTLTKVVRYMGWFLIAVGIYFAYKFVAYLVET